MSERSASLNQFRLETTHTAKCELAERILRSFGELRLRVAGFSMIPSVWPGDILLIRSKKIDQVSPGDIVLFARNGRLVAHRVLFVADDQEPACLITRGDALSEQDSRISAAEFLGKVSFIQRGADWLEPSTRPGFVARFMAAFVSRCGWIVSVLVRLRGLQESLRERLEARCGQ
jgi:signal peptidase I